MEGRARSVKHLLMLPFQEPILFYILCLSLFKLTDTTVPGPCIGYNMMWSSASSVCGIVAEMRQIHMDYRVLWRKRDTWLLSQEESALTLALTGFYWLNLPRNTGGIWKAHQSLSGSNDQTIDNIQRTMRAYFESGSDS